MEKPTVESGANAADAQPDHGGAALDSGAACRSGQLLWGVNIHNGGSDPQELASVMSARHLTTARMDLYANDSVYLAAFRAAAAFLAVDGVKVEAILYDTYSQGNPQSQNCGADLATVESDGYRQTLNQIQASEDIVSDFELMNETDLSPNIKGAGTTGQNASDYNVPCGLMQAANLRGMSRAVVDERIRTGRPLRIILGTTDRSFGFLSFMRQENVTFDVVGYHVYPWEQNPPLDQDPWFGPGGPLGQLAKFNRPIHINEFNCGEIYSGPPVYPNDTVYENKAGQAVTEACLRSVAKHLKEIVNQTVANIESVHFYEMWDEISKAPPENRFGLMYDLKTPKVQLFLTSAFSGGTLSAAETFGITSRSLLTATQILSWHPCGAVPAAFGVGD